MRELACAMAAGLLIASSPAAADGAGPAVAAMNHVAISATDADKSAAFYEELFGFRQIPTPVPMARWLVMANGVTLHIVGNRTVRTSHDRWDHLALACADLDALIAKLDARHIAWTNMAGGHAPQVRPDGVRQIFIQDPDGYWIEVNDAAKRK